MGSAITLPAGQTQFCDAAGTPYANGQVFHYIPGSTSPKTTWQDPLEATANTNPVVLDGAGRATIFGDGQYRQILQDQFGNTIWDKVTVALGSTSLAGSVPIMVGDTGSGGAAGQVPAPPAGSAALGEYLSADGTFKPLQVVMPAAPTANQAGFLYVPNRQVTLTSAALALSDSGSSLSYANASAGSLLITGDASVNWALGVITQIMLFNPPTSGIWTLTPDSGVALIWPGNTGTSATRALAPNSQALLSRVGANFWTVVGAGVS